MGSFIYPVVTETVKKLPYYLIGVGCDWEQEQIDRPFGYPTHQWIHCIKGSGSILVDGTAGTIAPGQGLLLAPGVPHSYSAQESPWVVHWITFSGPQAANLLQCIGLTESKIYWCIDGGAVSSDIREAYTVLAQDESPEAGFKCSAIVYRMLMHLHSFAHGSADETSSARHSRLRPVFDYISMNYQNPLTIQELADTIQVTPQYLCMLFKDLVHCRPFAYITQFRINKSKELLIMYPDMKISDIAKAVGYDNESYFGTIFRKTEGTSPSSYRNLHGAE